MQEPNVHLNWMLMPVFQWCSGDKPQSCVSQTSVSLAYVGLSLWRHGHVHNESSQKGKVCGVQHGHDVSRHVPRNVSSWDASTANGGSSSDDGCSGVFCTRYRRRVRWWYGSWSACWHSDPTAEPFWLAASGGCSTTAVFIAPAGASFDSADGGWAPETCKFANLPVHYLHQEHPEKSNFRGDGRNGPEPGPSLQLRADDRWPSDSDVALLQGQAHSSHLWFAWLGWFQWYKRHELFKFAMLTRH